MVSNTINKNNLISNINFEYDDEINIEVNKINLIKGKQNNESVNETYKKYKY